MDMAFLFLGISSSVLLNDFLNLFKLRFTKYSATFIGIFFVSVYFFYLLKI